MEVKDPITGEVVFTGLSVEEEKAKLAEEVALGTNVTGEPKEEAPVEEVKEEVAPNSKLAHYIKLEELQAGRPISEIPLNDDYWAYKASVDHLI